MGMGRKDFEALAALVAAKRLSLGDAEQLANDVADLCAARCPAFDRARFMNATRRDPISGTAIP